MEDAYDGFTTSNGVGFIATVYDRVADIGRTASVVRAVSNPAYQRRRRLGTGI